MRLKIESELLRTQVACCLDHIKIMDAENRNLAKLAASTKIMEARAEIAEEYVKKLSDFVLRLKYAVPQLFDVVKAVRTKSEQSCETIALQSSRLQEIGDNNNSLFELHENDRETIDKLRNDVRNNEEVIESLKLKIFEVSSMQNSSPNPPPTSTNVENSPDLNKSFPRNISLVQAIPLTNLSETPRKNNVIIEPKISGSDQIGSPTLNQVRDLKDKIKVLQMKVGHLQSKLDLSELSKQAMSVNIEQLKSNLDKISSQKSMIELNEVKKELYELKTSGLLGKEQLIRENRLLKVDIETQKQESESLKNQIKNMKTSLLQVIQTAQLSNPNASFGHLAESLLMLKLNGENKNEILDEEINTTKIFDIDLKDEDDDDNADALFDLLTGRMFNAATGTLHSASTPPEQKSKVDVDRSFLISFPGSASNAITSPSSPLEISFAREKLIVSPKNVRELTLFESDAIVDVDLRNSPPKENASAVHSIVSAEWSTKNEALDADQESDINSSIPLDPRHLTISSISPVVEDRLLQNIFAKYTSESRGILRASRLNTIIKYL